MKNYAESLDFRPTASWKNLQLRADMLRRLRRFFDDRGFLEVETPILSVDTVVDRHLDPFYVDIPSGCAEDISPLPLGEGQGVRAVSSGQWSAASTSEIRNQKSEISNSQSSTPNPSATGPHPNPLRAPTEGWSGEGTGRRMWLQTSPEFAMKRLLAAGGRAIYQIARVFRRDELGPLHNPEFTLVEWYRAGDGLNEGMTLTGDLCETMFLGSRHTPCAVGGSKDIGFSTMAEVHRSETTSANGTQSVPAAWTAERISYREAFERYVGIDPHTADGAALAETVRASGIEPPASLATDDRDGWLDLLLVEKVQPHLGVERPALLYDYPASQAALAYVRPGNPPVAERFELYVAGIELANGYHELLDPTELRARNAQVNAQRVADGKPALPEESRLLEAMQSSLPSAVGVALGFDRLVMLAAGAKSIAEVLAFPFDRA